MSHHNLNLPEPTLPEHLLIRDAAPNPQLSTGLKARVMSDCATSIQKARRIRQWKAAGSVAAICCLGLLFAVSLPQTETPEHATTQQVAPEYVSPGSENFRPGGSLAVDQPGNGAKGSGDANEIIEDLRGRTLDANMLFR